MKQISVLNSFPDMHKWCEHAGVRDGSRLQPTVSTDTHVEQHGYLQVVDGDPGVRGKPLHEGNKELDAAVPVSQE